jgi:hypothetical protein
MPISKISDQIGPLAKCTKDVAIMLDVMVDPSKAEIPPLGYISSFSSDWKGLKIGAVDVEPWLLSSFLVKPVESATRQEVPYPLTIRSCLKLTTLLIREIHSAYKRLQGILGDSFHQNIDLVSAKDVGEDSNGVDHFEDVTCSCITPSFL